MLSVFLCVIGIVWHEVTSVIRYMFVCNVNKSISQSVVCQINRYMHAYISARLNVEI